MDKIPTEQLVQLIDSVSANYKGDAHVLFGAIGALMVGRLYGWRVIRVFLSNATYVKYQKVLGISFKDYMPPETELSDRSLAYKVIKNLKVFWGIVRGQVPIDQHGISKNLKSIIE